MSRQYLISKLKRFGNETSRGRPTLFNTVINLTPYTSSFQMYRQLKVKLIPGNNYTKQPELSRKNQVAFFICLTRIYSCHMHFFFSVKYYNTEYLYNLKMPPECKITHQQEKEKHLSFNELHFRKCLG